AKVQSQKDRAPKRIVRANSNPEIKRKFASQEIISKGINQSSSKKNSFQQVKRRSTLSKRTNRKVQKSLNPHPKPRSGEKK
ncbi:TPA: hypothetical protein IYE77_003221, partial [Enterococcus faecium]|nr:hypothetical protein [Enterococcus faecium]